MTPASTAGSHGTARPRVVAITQARLGSTRLPAKVLKEILGRPLLWYHLTRLQRARSLDQLVVATTVDSAPILEICASLGIASFEGSEDDVLARFHGCAESFEADIVVRLTSDCPLIDPALVDRAVERFLAAGDLDYLHLNIDRYPRGLDTEVFTRAALEKAHAEAEDASEREHVTPFIWRRPQRFRIEALSPEDPSERHDYRWTVDEAADFELVRHLIEALHPKNPAFGWRDALALLERRPDWAAINANIAQKDV